MLNKNLDWIDFLFFFIGRIKNYLNHVILQKKTPKNHALKTNKTYILFKVWMFALNVKVNNIRYIVGIFNKIVKASYKV